MVFGFQITYKIGLCFSGGGIRSASYCMGVLKKLHEEEWLQKFDYLSTVSGGGYTGTCAI